MPAQTERLLWRFLGGARVGQKSASGAYTDLTNTGYQTMSGCARVYKDIFIAPRNFDVPLGAASGAGIAGASGACGAGSLFASCVLFDVTGSIFGGAVGLVASPKVTSLNMGVGASPASALGAMATFAKPTDADTTGSIIVYVDWTYGGTPATTGSKVTMYAGMGYLGTGSTIRTAASVGPTACAGSYAGTSCGLFQTTCLGKLPSFTANDQLGFLFLRLGASVAADTGALTTGCVHILGVRLRYVVNSLGVQVAE